MDQYVIDNLFYSFDGEDGTVYWREVVDGEGYIVYWNFEGDEYYHHTYHYPPNVWALDSKR